MLRWPPRVGASGPDRDATWPRLRIACDLEVEVDEALDQAEQTMLAGGGR